MSVLGDAIRNNADLHKAVHRILTDLAALHLGKSYGRPPDRAHLDYLCALAASALPHFPPPPEE